MESELPLASAKFGVLVNTSIVPWSNEGAGSCGPNVACCWLGGPSGCGWWDLMRMIVELWRPSCDDGPHGWCDLMMKIVELMSCYGNL